MQRVPSPPNGLNDGNPFPPDCAAKFTHVRRIAAGGFGAVFQAIHRELKRPVAIKLLLEDVLKIQEQVQRFNNEARITASLSNRHVIQLIDHGAEFGIPWIAYEFVAGKSLREILEASPGGMEFGAAITATMQIADALAEAHSKQILHRDIKPDNVLEAEPGHFKVSDFGIAKWSHEGAVKTATGIVLGTPAYISPEQILGSPPSAASDVYATGVLLFELLTGSRPYDHENYLILLEHHLKSPIPRATERKPGLPKGIDAVIARAMSKQPRERHESAGALRDELAALLARGSRDLAPVSGEGSGRFGRQSRFDVTRPSLTGMRRSGRLSMSDRSAAVSQAASDAASHGRGWRALALGAAVTAVLLVAALVWVARSKPVPEPVRATPSPVALPPMDRRKELARLHEQLVTCTGTPGLPPAARLAESVLRQALVVCAQAPEAVRPGLWLREKGRPGLAAVVARALDAGLEAASITDLAGQVAALAALDQAGQAGSVARAAQAALRLAQVAGKPGSWGIQGAFIAPQVSLLEALRTGDAATFAQVADLLASARLSRAVPARGLLPAGPWARFERTVLLIARLGLRRNAQADPELTRVVEADLAKRPASAAAAPPKSSPPPTAGLALPPELEAVLKTQPAENWQQLRRAASSPEEFVPQMADSEGLEAAVVQLLALASRQSESLRQATQRALQAWLAGQAPRAAAIPVYWLTRESVERGDSSLDAERAIVRLDWLLHGLELAAETGPVDPTGQKWTLGEIQRGVAAIALAGAFAKEWDVIDIDDPVRRTLVKDDEDGDRDRRPERLMRDATSALAIRMSYALFPTAPLVVDAIARPPFARVGFRFHYAFGLELTARLAAADHVERGAMTALRSEAAQLLAAERPYRMLSAEAAVRLLDASLSAPALPRR